MGKTEGKGSAVQAMFDDIAHRYDLMNRVITFGMDQSWRRYAIGKTRVESGDRVLDLAAGTGDIALEMVSRHPDLTVVAGDFSTGMMEVGSRRPGGRDIAWVACDAMAMPFADASFDAVIFGYLLRNVEDIDQTLTEVFRILRPGGRVVCLETTPPRGFLKPFVSAYVRWVVPLLGRILAGSSGSYAYLAGSTMEFLDARSLASRFSSAGFTNVEYRVFKLGSVAVHWAEKKAV